MKNIWILVLLSLIGSSCSINRYSKVHTSSEFTGGIEGPDCDDEGNLFVVNYKEEGTIGVIPFGKNKTELFVKLPEKSVGNGIQFLNDSIFFVADYVNHNVFKVNKNTKEIIVYHHNDSMNQPNDLAISPSGRLYASDPNWAMQTGKLWSINSAGKSMLLESNMGTTNGVEVSPDGAFLFVNESVQKRVWKYDIHTDGSVHNKTLFHQFNEDGMDGMRCDKKGNLYIARYGRGTVAILSSAGVFVREIKLQGPNPTNVAFGPSYRKLYVTMQKKKWVEVINIK
jgi:gluconolactonase